MKIRKSLLYPLTLFFLITSGCSVRFPKAESYHEPSLPIAVSVSFEQNRVAYEAGNDANDSMGAVLVQQLRNTNVFRSLEFPANNKSAYQLLLSVSGEFDRELGFNRLKRALVGLSLFLLSPFFDMTATYSHSLEARLLYRGEFIGQYSVGPIESIVRKRHGPVSSRLNKADFNRAKTAHAGRLATALARAISRDRQNILAASGQ